jgi:hypothetical protein
MIRNWLSAWFVLAVLTSLGCSRGDKWTKNLPETVTAEGVVTLDGKPVEGASLIFAPVDPTGYAANDLTDSRGRFSLNAFPSKPGAVPGEYQVGVSKTVEMSAGAVPAQRRQALGEDAGHAAEAGSDVENPVSWKNVLPQKYASPPLSGLTVTIPPEGISEIKIELSSK